MAAVRPESPTVDADEVARFERLAATWWDPRGTCPDNCSFVSGDVSGGFWTMAPAALAPPAWRVAACVSGCQMPPPANTSPGPMCR